MCREYAFPEGQDAQTPAENYDSMHLNMGFEIHSVLMFKPGLSRCFKASNALQSVAG